MPGVDELRAHTLAPPVGLAPCASVLDVGAGIRPCPWYPTAQIVCVEPFGPYADRLARAGYAVVRATAQEALGSLRADAVVMLDVLEHLSRRAGRQVLDLALRAATRQVVVYTPDGFLPQEGDAWGLGGDEWQRHRSGWRPADFPGWAIEHRARGFFALWSAT